MSLNLARQSDPLVSVEAATSILTHIGEHEDRILSALETYGPLTKSQIAHRTGLDGAQVCRRLPALYERGEAAPTGYCRKSFSGRMERVWGLVA